MRESHDILREVYGAFNARDIDGVLVSMHPDVEWPNGMEGGMVYGHSGVREYWSRQWKVINPHFERVGFRPDPSGRIIVDVHQVIHREGKLLVDRMVQHVYVIEEGLIRSMEVRE